MTTSGTYTFSATRDFIVQEAFRKIGRFGDYETLDNNRLTVGINALNPMVKAFHAMGMPLWAITEQYISFNFWASGGFVTIGPGQTISQLTWPLKVLQAVRRDNSQTGAPIDVPMNIYTYEDYERLANKGAQGAPIHIFHQPLNGTSQIAIYLVPDSYWVNQQLYIRYQRPFQDFDNSTDTPDFPVEWHEALIYGLAFRLAPTYGLPPDDRDRLKKDAEDLLMAAKEFSVEEGSIFLRPARWWK